MISIDRKVCKDILKITKDYNVSVIFAPELGGYAKWHMYLPEKAERISSVRVDEVPEALNRLVERKFIRKINGSMSGAMVFRIMPELLHAKAFWFDRFSKKFWVGLVSGIVIGLIANLLTGPVQLLLSKLFQLLQSLL